MSENLQKKRVRQKRFYHTHRIEILQNRRDTRSSEEQRNKKLRYRYGISLTQAEALLAFQNGKCKICGVSIAIREGAHIDHCHKTNRIRGILCGLCNKGLGQFKDNPVIVYQAYQYLL